MNGNTVSIRREKALRVVFSVLLVLGSATSASAQTTTPIEHLVVIFQENVSFDHYFGTYPVATNPPGEPVFKARSGILFPNPAVNGLNNGLMTHNPNSTQPFRIDRAHPVVCDQDHACTDEQKAFDTGLMDKFPESVGSGTSTEFPCDDLGLGTGLVMGYYDGNTVTALWNYAQHFALSDNSYGTIFGPSTPGALPQ